MSTDPLPALAEEITITGEALRRLTTAQRDRLVVLIRGFRPVGVKIYTQFDLPEGYVAFHLRAGGTRPGLFGGIDTDGSAST